MLKASLVIAGAGRMPFSFFRNLAIALLVPLSAAAMILQSSIAEHPAVAYSRQPAEDRMSRLIQKLTGGEETLEFDSKRGYLPSLLGKLNIPVSSQALVFSKTSLQVDRIQPRRPRALYFDDDIYIGWIPNAPLIELASVDPQLGTVFYTLEQVESATPRFQRHTSDCLSCHSGAFTGGVPGLVMRSVYPDNEGNAILRAGTFLTTDRSPWRERWGGWYVTGTHGNQSHMGNLMAAHHLLAIGAKARAYVSSMDLTAGTNLKDVRSRFDSDYYLSPHSDLVALLVLTHQTNMHNLITRMNYEARIARFEDPAGKADSSIARGLRNTAEAVVEAMLFAGEPELMKPVMGTSGFREQFSLSGPRDRKGRSLRDLDLNRRLFRYPLSYLIYSDAFRAIPETAKTLIYDRLRQILNGTDTSGQFDHLSEADRTAILEILKDTVPGW
jgi:hypothetical protein